MKKIVSLLLAAVMAISLAACGEKSSPEEPVKGFCEAIIAWDYTKAASYFDSADDAIETLFEEDLEGAEQVLFDYWAANAKKITYSLGEPMPKGDDFVIPVTFNYMDGTPVITAVMAEYFTQGFALALSGADEETLNELMGTIMSEQVEKVEPDTATSVVEFCCTKKEGTWVIQQFSDEARQAMLNIITCNFDKAMESLTEEGDVELSPTVDLSEYEWKDVPLGETAELDTINLTIKGVEEETELTGEFSDPDVAPEGTKFVAISASIENTTKKTLEFSNEFALYDSQGREFLPYIDAHWYYEETFLYAELSPNIPTAGTLVYHVPSDAEGYYIAATSENSNKACRMLTE